MLAEKNMYFLIKKTPEQELKKYGIPNTPSLRRQMSIKASSPEQKVLCYVKALFEYDPYEDALHPCPDAGLSFQYGDILAVVNQDGSFNKIVYSYSNSVPKSNIS
jgi:hypothetical protein